MVGRAHTKEPVGLLNVSSTHLKTLFDGMSWSFCGMTTTYHRRGCLNV
jgi:hypothetical protein